MYFINFLPVLVPVEKLIIICSLFIAFLIAFFKQQQNNGTMEAYIHIASIDVNLNLDNAPEYPRKYS